MILGVALAYTIGQLAKTRRLLKNKSQKTCDAATQLPEDEPSVADTVALRQLKGLLEKQRLTSAIPDDNELHCLLQATQQDAAAACQRVLATEKWRASRRTSQAAVQPAADRGGASSSSSSAALRRVAFQGSDLAGNPCLRVRLRDPLGTLPEELLETLEQHFERAREQQRHQKRQQICILIDVSDLDYRTLLRPPLAAGFELVKELRAHYPQRASAVHIVHLPAIARWLVGAACSVLDSRTAKKVLVHEANGAAIAKALAGHFDPSQLPREYGGTDPRPLLPGEVPRHAPSARAPSPPATPPKTPVARSHPSPSASGAASGAASGVAGGAGPRHIWSVMSEREAAEVRKLREAGTADEEIRSIPWPQLTDVASWPDDELLRFLIDTTPPFNQVEGLNNVRCAAKSRATMLSRPIPREAIEAWSRFARFDGVTRSGEPALLVVMSRQLQDALLADPEPFLTAICGLLVAARAEHFRPGEMETVQTVVQVERGFKLEVPVAAAQRLMLVITECFPSFTSKILIVNLPGYLSWFVKFVKGFLCEGSQRKLELISDFNRLLDFYEPGDLPSYYRERGSIVP